MNIVMDAFDRVLTHKADQRPSQQRLYTPEHHHNTHGNRHSRRRYSNAAPLNPSHEALKGSVSENDFVNPSLDKKMLGAHSCHLTTPRSSSGSRGSSRTGRRRPSDSGLGAVAAALLSVLGPADPHKHQDFNHNDCGARGVRKRESLSVSPRLSVNLSSAAAASQYPAVESMKSEEVIEVLSGGMSVPAQTVFLGFLRSESDGQSDELSAYGFKREDQRLDKALGECSVIKNKDGLSQALLLKCMDNKPMYNFLHYAIYKNGCSASSNVSSSPSKQISAHLAEVNSLVGELRAGNSRSEYGSYEELFAIQKSATSNSDQRLSSNRHSGYIVTCFKLLDENHRQQSLEKTWLSWTGAREIYKYSPRTWNLRRITLHRHSSMIGPVRTFAYVLVCEFNNILHPSNTLQALDMCERLRARNCGHIALYQVQHCYGPSSLFGSATLAHRASISGTQRKYSHNAHSLNSPSSSSPMTTSNQSLAQQQQVSPWSSPKLVANAATAAVRRREMLRGYSQDVDSAHETSRRRTALLRMRDRSLGYDFDDSVFLSSLSNTSAAVSIGNVARKSSSPRNGSPAVSTMNLTPPPRFPTYPNYHQFVQELV